MPPTRQTSQIVKGRLGFLNGRASDDLIFQFNPTQIERARDAMYAPNQAALADFPNSTLKQLPAVEWIRNNAEEINLDLFFFERGDKNIEPQLKKLDALMKPDPNTGKPRDLVLSMGPRHDRVRIKSKRVVENLFDPKLNVQQARVTLVLTALTSRSG